MAISPGIETDSTNPRAGRARAKNGRMLRGVAEVVLIVVPESAILGEALAIYWPISQIHGV